MSNDVFVPPTRTGRHRRSSSQGMTAPRDNSIAKGFAMALGAAPVLMLTLLLTCWLALEVFSGRVRALREGPQPDDEAAAKARRSFDGSR